MKRTAGLRHCVRVALFCLAIPGLLMIAVDFSLDQNYPNPFNPSTVVRFGLPMTADVTLEIYDILGRRITTAYRGELNAGYHEVPFRDESLASGVYVYRMKAGDFSATRRFMLLR